MLHDLLPPNAGPQIARAPTIAHANTMYSYASGIERGEKIR